MRISGGVAKGRRTATEKLSGGKVPGERLRPTSSKVREALFDIIRNRLESAHFVDLYAGSGTVGLEALSRGAEHVVFVEPDKLRTEMIQKNIESLGFSGNASISRTDAEKFLKKAELDSSGYDILFLDPPYRSEEIEKVFPLIESTKILNDDGLVIIEHFFKKTLPRIAGRLILSKQYRYGDTMLTLYRKERG
ncbi:MAG: 16S rRNA (guanine(966)-N(2))-methyltransferase RsmD [Thermodesulfovibrionales bacterium]|nr:16S rRNA (guanine(966)-N(2))-methyltransferase RsmD [Thermodesulfovibrionales bacterium]